jgi:hypothetical protein
LVGPIPAEPLFILNYNLLKKKQGSAGIQGDKPPIRPYRVFSRLSISVAETPIDSSICPVWFDGNIPL